MTHFIHLCWLVVELAFLAILFLIVSGLTAAVVMGPPFIAGRWIVRAVRREHAAH